MNSLEDYHQYTITFDSPSTRATLDPDARITSAQSFVESLNLPQEGFSYIEEACLNELEAYKGQNVILDNYTVLVPKDASTPDYFGTYGAYDYYSSLTSQSDKRIETDTEKKNDSNSLDWEYWVSGIVDVATYFVGEKLEFLTLPYSVIMTISGVSDVSEIHNESYFQYVTQYFDVQTRTVYRKVGSTFKPCYQDQFGSFKINQYFCPVGNGFPSDYMQITPPGGYQVTDKWSTDKTDAEILQSASIYANHNSMAEFVFMPGSVIQKWDAPDE